MEKSPTFSHDKLIQWLHAHIPIYQSAQQITAKVSTQQNKATFTKKDDVNDKQTEKMLQLLESQPKEKKKIVDALMQLDDQLEQERSK